VLLLRPQPAATATAAATAYGHAQTLDTGQRAPLRYEAVQQQQQQQRRRRYDNAQGLDIGLLLRQPAAGWIPQLVAQEQLVVDG